MALMVGNKTIVLEEDERQREALKDPFRKPRTWGPLGNLFADLVLLLDVSRSLGKHPSNSCWGHLGIARKGGGSQPLPGWFGALF